MRFTRRNSCVPKRYGSGFPGYNCADVQAIARTSPGGDVSYLNQHFLPGNAGGILIFIHDDYSQVNSYCNSLSFGQFSFIPQGVS